ncbi:hypothetical protein [Bifidobacterium bifidum]|uniref:hypothetical protein n=1 Tax=Bifidobacterium bifidum TaxID=1681 RepID=UPI0034A0E071
MSRPETALYAYQHGWQAAIDLCIAIEQTINEYAKRERKAIEYVATLKEES